LGGRFFVEMLTLHREGRIVVSESEGLGGGEARVGMGMVQAVFGHHEMGEDRVAAVILIEYC